MPPLLAALLMMEFDCTLDIVEAIDLGVEWRRFWKSSPTSREYSKHWYDGLLGGKRKNWEVSSVRPGDSTYLWPSPVHYVPRYYSSDTCIKLGE